MAPSQLVAWVRRWVTRVTNELGVHPMLYSSPNFWTTNMGNSSWFADHGYRLWLAHWNVSSPTVPANDWQGDGWTFWQYDDCGRVPGIVGCVDLDFSASADLTSVIIPSPDTVAPVASFLNAFM